MTRMDIRHRGRRVCRVHLVLRFRIRLHPKAGLMNWLVCH